MMDNPLGESEQAYRALMSLMRSNNGANSDDSSNNEEDDNFKPGASFASAATGTSGFWSAIAPLPNADDYSESSSSGSKSTTRSNLSESSPLTFKRRQRRQLYARRCACAMVGFVALMTLSGSVIYLVADEEEGSIFEALHDNFWGRFTGNKKLSSEEQEEENNIEEAARDLIVQNQGLPGGQQEDDWRTSWRLPGGERDARFMTTRQGRDQRMRARAVRLGHQRQLRDNYHAQQDYKMHHRQMMMQDEEEYYGRRSLAPDAEGYFIPQEVQEQQPLVHDERLSWQGHPQEEYQQDYNGHPY